MWCLVNMPRARRRRKPPDKRRAIMKTGAPRGARYSSQYSQSMRRTRPASMWNVTVLGKPSE